MIELIFNLNDLTPLWPRITDGLDDKTRLNGALNDLIAQPRAGGTLLPQAANTGNGTGD